MKGEYEVLDILEEQKTPQQRYVYTFKEMSVSQFIQQHNLKYDTRTIGRVLKKYGYESKLRKEKGEVARVIKLPFKYWSDTNK